MHFLGARLLAKEHCNWTQLRSFTARPLAKVLPRMIIGMQVARQTKFSITRNGKISASHFDMQDIGTQSVVGKSRKSFAVVWRISLAKDTFYLLSTGVTGLELP